MNCRRNRPPTKSLDDKTSFKVWPGNVPNIPNFRMFGSKVYYLNRKPCDRKYAAWDEEGIFLRYDYFCKRYPFWSPKKRNVIISRDVKFLEDTSNEPYEVVTEVDRGRDEVTATKRSSITLLVRENRNIPTGEGENLDIDEKDGRLTKPNNVDLSEF